MKENDRWVYQAEMFAVFYEPKLANLISCARLVDGVMLDEVLLDICHLYKAAALIIFLEPCDEGSILIRVGFCSQCYVTR